MFDKKEEPTRMQRVCDNCTRSKICEKVGQCAWLCVTCRVLVDQRTNIDHNTKFID